MLHFFLEKSKHINIAPIKPETSNLLACVAFSYAYLDHLYARKMHCIQDIAPWDVFQNVSVYVTSNWTAG